MFVMTDEVKRELDSTRAAFRKYAKDEADLELKRINKQIAELEAEDADRIKEEREKKEDADMIAAFDEAWNS